MKRRWQIIFKVILLILFILQLFNLIYRAIDYTKHYPTLIGAYCFIGKIPLDYIENKNLDDILNIQQCSLENINACQYIHNQTLLFRLKWNSDFISEINNLIRAFIYAIYTHRKFLIDDQYWNYGLFSFYFNMSQGYFSPWLPLSSYCIQRKFIHFIHYKPNNESIPEHFTIARDMDGSFSSLNFIMKSLEENNKILKIKRIVARYLWKTLNNETKNFIYQYLNKIQINSITYAIHIDRYDNLKKEGNEISLNEYINGIEFFMRKHSRNDSNHRIYIASDENNAIEEFRLLRPQWEFVQLFQTYLQFYDHSHIPLYAKIEATRILITEIEILSRVKYVVCTFSSDICRLVQILRKQKPDTVLSLDEEWFPQ